MRFNFQNTSKITIRLFFLIIFVTISIICTINALNILVFHAVSNDQCAWRPVDNRKDAYLITDVVPGGVTDKAGIKNGDILLKINGISFTTETPVPAMSIVNAIQRGDYATYLIERNGLVFETKVEILKVFDVVFFASFLFGLGFTIVGLVVVLTRPEGIRQRQFAFFSMLLMLYFGLTQIYLLNQVIWFTSILRGLIIISRIIFPPFFIYYFLNYPIKRNPKMNRWVFSILLLISVLAGLNVFIGPFARLLPQFLILILTSFPAISFIAGLIIFTITYFKDINKEDRKQFKPILISSFIGVAAFFYVFYINSINPFLIFIKPVLLLPSLLVLLIPLSFGYSIFKYRLMDIQFIIKKSIIYGVITTTIAIIYITLVFGVGTMLKDVLGQSESQVLSVLALVIIAFVFDPIKKKVQNSVDKVFYRERYDYQKALLDFSKILPLKLNINQILNSVINTISSTMHVEKIAGILLDESKGSVCFAKNIPDELCVYSNEPQGLLNFLNIKKQPINVSSLIDEKSYYNISDDEISKIIKSGVQVIVPMITNDKVVGFINTGPKLSERVYSEEDIDLLNTVASQAAIAIENARLHEKEKTLYQVQEEIKLASKIQTEWLPTTSPHIKNFDITGRTIPAKVVGGDYYDYMEIDEETCSLCIGDVSGKGLPAAMLMAYVQAILRSQSLSVNDLKSCIQAANKLVYKNSMNDMFVTLFYSILDYNHKILYYSNAGHNYPILLSSNNDDKFLFEGGLPLGVDLKTKYETGQVKLIKDDLLVMYTDGITETFNKIYEQYGEERLYDIIRKNRNESSEIIINKIIADVEEFRKEADVFDDMTLVVVKCNV